VRYQVHTSGAEYSVRQDCAILIRTAGIPRILFVGGCQYGKYQKGFWNSLFGQEGVIQTSEGYNYISKNGDIWLYTGMTSAASDESNLGFMLVDLRTHEAQYTAVSCATETAVMASAEG
jgi:hypothetical protein